MNCSSMVSMEKTKINAAGMTEAGWKCKQTMKKKKSLEFFPTSRNQKNSLDTKFVINPVSISALPS